MKRVWAGLFCVLLWATLDSAQERMPNQVVDFLDERLYIPESVRFREADYIESGVGLKFGVDKRLSYFTGDYGTSIQSFEEAVRRFRFKSEIWVYLARSYFYMKTPEDARKTIERAAQAMPDLKEAFWDPLLESMSGEIRRRANIMQTEVDFYSKAQGDFLSLFRLYTFLKDYEAAAEVIRAADGKADKMNELAGMASMPSQRLIREKAKKWEELAEGLRGELEALGMDPPQRVEKPELSSLPEIPGEDVDLVEMTRFLQLKIDYYPADPQDYRDLLDNYLQLDLPQQAAGVVESLNREIQRVELLADIAPNPQQEWVHISAKNSLEKLRQELLDLLERPAGDAAP